MQNNKAYTMRKQWCDACLSVGIPALSTDTSARIMAVLYVHGNNEAFTLSGHFNADREYIQQRFHINGGEVPDAEFARLLKGYVRELEEYENNKANCEAYHGYGDAKPEWAQELFRKMYGFEV